MDEQLEYDSERHITRWHMQTHNELDQIAAQHDADYSTQVQHGMGPLINMQNQYFCHCEIIMSCMAIKFCTSLRNLRHGDFFKGTKINTALV